MSFSFLSITYNKSIFIHVEFLYDQHTGAAVHHHVFFDVHHFVLESLFWSFFLQN